MSRLIPRPRNPQKIEGKTRTQQQFKDEVNIGNIVRKYRKTGIVTHLNGKQPVYADISSVDYSQMRNLLQDIQIQFESYPSKIRNRFQNDPYQMVRFIEDPSNQAEAVKLGLIPEPPKQPKNPVSSEPVTPPAGGKAPSNP